MLGASCIFPVTSGLSSELTASQSHRPASVWQVAAGHSFPVETVSGRLLVRRASHQESLNLCELCFNIFMLIQIDFFYQILSLKL